MPSAEDQAALSDADLEASAAQWATALKDAGVDYNLAPVADVVPADLLDVNQPIGVLRRGYGSDPATVKAKALAFIEGMHAVGIATALKHFPGLGQVRGNTDQEIGVTDDVTTTADLQTFTGYPDETSVMVSSAIYTDRRKQSRDLLTDDHHRRAPEPARLRRRRHLGRHRRRPRGDNAPAGRPGGSIPRRRRQPRDHGGREHDHGDDRRRRRTRGLRHRLRSEPHRESGARSRPEGADRARRLCTGLLNRGSGVGELGQAGFLVGGDGRLDDRF